MEIEVHPSSSFFPFSQYVDASDLIIQGEVIQLENIVESKIIFTDNLSQNRRCFEGAFSGKQHNISRYWRGIERVGLRSGRKLPFICGRPNNCPD